MRWIVLVPGFLTAGLLACPALAEVAPRQIAASQRLGVEVTADSANWCAAANAGRPLFTVVADKADTFQAPDLLATLQRLGTALVARDCPTAQGIDLQGQVRGGAAVIWRARADAAAGWVVQVAAAVAPKAMDLDEPAPAAAAVVAAPQILRIADGARSIGIAGHQITLTQAGPYTFGLTVDGGARGPLEADLPPFFQDARVVAGVGYVLIRLPVDGNGCSGGKYTLVILRGAAVARTANFGNCTEWGQAIAASDTGWSSEEPGPKPEQRTRFSVSGDRITTQVIAQPIKAAGPAGGDIRALLLGKAPADFATSQLAEAALRAAVPQASYATLREMALGGPQSPFERRGDYIIGTGCRAHACGSDDFAIGYGPGNQAVAMLRLNGRMQFFGGPNAATQAMLTRR